MANLESDVRGKIVTAIEGIYSTLGFDDSPGNVKSYLLEWEQPEKVVEYLMSEVGSKKIARAWGVQVLAREELEGGSAPETYRRFYEIEVVGYYGVAGSSTPINTLIDDAEKVREAIKNLTSRLDGSVDKVVRSGVLSLAREQAKGVGEIWVGTLSYEAEKYGPDW